MVVKDKVSPSEHVASYCHRRFSFSNKLSLLQERYSRVPLNVSQLPHICATQGDFNINIR